MKKIIVLLIACLLAHNVVTGQKKADKPIPMDKSIRYGKLENGITYYICNNDVPKNSATFAFVQNAGALLESDEQNGLAHFLEHLAFNGTKHFPGKSMINMLQQHGLKMGTNINAYTSQNETCYSLTDVPMDNETLLDSCLLILHDWCNEVSFTNEEIEAERGVITEEWRQVNDANARIRNQIAPALYNNSIYSKRDVIGSLDVIQNFNPSLLRNFYHDWYRTDLQCIIICGDVNVKKTENKIKALFSTIPAVKNAPERPVFKIEDHNEIKYVTASDAEMQYTTIGMYIRHKNDISDDNTYGTVLKNYLNTLCNSMIENRISRWSTEGELPFFQAAINYGGYVRGYDLYSFVVIPKQGQEKESLKKIADLQNDIYTNGFKADELLMGKTNLLMSLENYYAQRDKKHNNDIFKECQNHYLNNGALGSIENLYVYSKNKINKLTLDDVNEHFNSWLIDKNKIIVVQGPEKSKDQFLSKDEILNIIEDKTNTSSSTTSILSANAKLLDIDLKPVAIVKEQKIDELNAQIWTLSNNAKVVYKYCNYHPETISFKAKSPGGMSLIDVDQLPSAAIMNTFLPMHGLGDYNINDLQQLLANTNVAMGPQIEGLYETIEGGCVKKDIETMFQLAYMVFEQPRFDEKVHNLLLSQARQALKQTDKTYESILSDSLLLILNSYNERIQLQDQKFYDAIDLNVMEKIYRERFTNAGDWVFYLVGDIKEKKAKELVAKYIGNIKSGNTETWRDNGHNFPKGITNKTLELEMEVPKAGVLKAYNCSLDYTYRNTFCFGIMTGLIDLKLNNDIREDAGGTYGVNLSNQVFRYPNPQFNLNIQFMCDPDKLEYLYQKTDESIREMINNGVDSKELNKIITSLLSAKAREVKDVNYWNQVLEKYIEFGEDHTKKQYYQDIIKSITENDINTMMKQYFKKSNLVNLKYTTLK